MIYLVPRGAPLTQARVRDLAAGPGAILLCGRFEGLDQRVIEARGIEEISLGDFVLAGGEIAAMALIEASRPADPRCPGRPSVDRGGKLRRPVFWNIRISPGPRSFDGRPIPDVLTSGNHAEIAKWRQAQAEALTRTRRPDLWTLYEKDKG